MVMVDLFCDNEECSNIKEDVMVDTSLDDHGSCDVCSKGKLKRMMPGQISFELKYNNRTDICSWGGDGYASSQYWNKIKGSGGNDPNADKWY